MSHVNDCEISAALAKLAIKEVLRQLNIPVHLFGYSILEYALFHGIVNENLLENIDSGLYPMIHNEFSVTGESVDNAVKHALRISWLRGGNDYYCEKFKICSTAEPSVKDFIVTVCSGLRESCYDNDDY